MTIDFDQIKIWGFNLSALIIQLTDLFGAIIGFVGAAAATGYTIHKWWILIKQQRKEKQDGKLG